MPTAAAMSRIDVPSYPRVEKRSRAAATIRLRLAAALAPPLGAAELAETRLAETWTSAGGIGGTLSAPAGTAIGPAPLLELLDVLSIDR
jgi:hypothetical protein